MGLKARLSSYCTKRSNNGVNLVTSRKINTRLARPMITRNELDGDSWFVGFINYRSMQSFFPK